MDRRDQRWTSDVGVGLQAQRSGAAAPRLHLHGLALVDPLAYFLIAVERFYVISAEVREHHPIDPSTLCGHDVRVRVHARADALKPVEPGAQSLPAMTVAEHLVETTRVNQSAIRKEMSR